jgi:hypothetical protein
MVCGRAGYLTFSQQSMSPEPGKMLGRDAQFQFSFDSHTQLES